jgi:hypothetical protein
VGPFLCTSVGLADVTGCLRIVFAPSERNIANICGTSVFLRFYSFLPELFFPDAEIFITEKVFGFYSFNSSDCLGFVSARRSIDSPFVDKRFYSKPTTRFSKFASF